MSEWWEELGPDVPKAAREKAKEREPGRVPPPIEGLFCDLCEVPFPPARTIHDDPPGSHITRVDGAVVCDVCACVWADEISQCTDWRAMAERLRVEHEDWFYRDVWDPPESAAQFRRWERNYVTTPAWRRRRWQAMELAGWKCELCEGAGTGLQAHHLDYARVGHEDMDDLLILCAKCHELEHDKQGDEDEQLEPVDGGLRVAEPVLVSGGADAASGDDAGERPRPATSPGARRDREAVGAVHGPRVTRGGPGPAGVPERRMEAPAQGPPAGAPRHRGRAGSVDPDRPRSATQTVFQWLDDHKRWRERGAPYPDIPHFGPDGHIDWVKARQEAS